MKDYVLNEKPEPASNEMVWAFDLGKGSIGEAVRRGNEFLHKAALLIPAEFEKDKTGKVALAGFVLETLVVAGVRPLNGERTACVPNFVLIPI